MLLFFAGNTVVFYARTLKNTCISYTDTNNKMVVMDENIKYYVVKQKALPEVLLKVAQANRLIETKGISVADATEPGWYQQKFLLQI